MSFLCFGKMRGFVPAWKDEPCAVSDFEGEVYMNCVLRTFDCGRLAVKRNLSWELARPDGTFESDNTPSRKWWRTHAARP